MTDAPPSILGQIALGYSPFVDRTRAIVATRLTIFPLHPEAAVDVGQLLHEIGNVWPATGARASLNVAGERLLLDLLRARPSPNLMIEVPAFLAADPANVDPIVALHRQGTTLLLKGRPLAELPRAVLPCFRWAIVDLGEDRRTAEDDGAHRELRSIPHVQSGVGRLGEMEDAFARGAEAVLGWPLDDAPPDPGAVEKPSSSAKAAAGRQAMQTIVELIALVDREAPLEAIDPVLKRDPALAFRLLRYLNSPAFGLRIEISSFRHAVMILGYARLKRWLALLLATAGGDDARAKPAMFAAVRRGLFLEELVRAGGDEALRGELFICGVFSLLDRMFGQPFTVLLASLPVPERVRLALADRAGPFVPYLALAEAIEGGALIEFKEAAEALLLSVAEINRAGLRALTAAAELE